MDAHVGYGDLPTVVSLSSAVVVVMRNASNSYFVFFNTGNYNWIVSLSGEKKKQTNVFFVLYSRLSQR